jgi:hypothetical protein
MNDCKLDQIKLNHKERKDMFHKYNEKIDYCKEAIQQWMEIEYLLTLIDVPEDYTK